MTTKKWLFFIVINKFKFRGNQSQAVCKSNNTTPLKCVSFLNKSDYRMHANIFWPTKQKNNILINNELVRIKLTNIYL